MKRNIIAAMVLFGFWNSAFAQVSSSSGGPATDVYRPSLDSLPRPTASTITGSQMRPSELGAASQIFYERCAGCHGVLRQGATGRALPAETMSALGEDEVVRRITHGGDTGMPSWGASEILSQNEIKLMARYLMVPPSSPPEFGLSSMRESWRNVVPMANRPIKKMNDLDLDNMFAVVLRDIDQVALIDGNSKKVVATIPTGHAVHVVRPSLSRRYLHIISRDGKASLVDLWSQAPQLVAEIKIGYEARAVEPSKFKGYEDRYVAVGAYWPPQFTILDGNTYEPLNVISTRGMIAGSGDYHPEARVASIIASYERPEFLVNVKETGQALLVDYTDVVNPTIKSLKAERFLHDGGLDSTRRYALIAANAEDKVVVVDTKERRVAAVVEKGIGIRPHPGRGANINHPQFGPAWVTGHLGDSTIAIIGTDPDKHPKNAWKVVQNLKGLGNGSLFSTTHPKSHHLWVDAPMNPSPNIAGSVAVFDVNHLDKPAKILPVANLAGINDNSAKVVHAAYDRSGQEVWLSVWNRVDRQSAIVVLDDETMKVKTIIADDRIKTPTGKFNIFNTGQDIY
ncbi:nitrite reductase [Paramagnetospirillum kuznetsovii]|uniref:Nitrite reductase n=2 Tax=Paramagnetospirillum kuznetsovii TaxID=2053833 RepID=A0A364NT96_9PROT|nr:nitrite reductase [Paramagnetospirillum kuznetsovii]